MDDITAKTLKKKLNKSSTKFFFQNRPDLDSCDSFQLLINSILLLLLRKKKPNPLFFVEQLTVAGQRDEQQQDESSLHGFKMADGSVRLQESRGRVDELRRLRWRQHWGVV